MMTPELQLKEILQTVRRLEAVVKTIENRLIKDEPLLTTSEAAKLAGVTHCAIYTAANNGMLPCEKKGDGPRGHLRFRREDVINYANNYKR